MLWNIWCEGYVINVMCKDCEKLFEAGAHVPSRDECEGCMTFHGIGPVFLVTEGGPIEAATFDEAVEKQRSINGFVNSAYGRDEDGWYFLDHDLRLHPTEEEAKQGTAVKVAKLSNL